LFVFLLGKQKNEIKSKKSMDGNELASVINIIIASTFNKWLSFVIATKIEILEGSRECMVGVVENCPVWHAFSAEETTVEILMGIQENKDIILST